MVENHTMLTNALCSAVNNRDLEVVKTLIKHGADINSVDENGQTPVMLAAERYKNYDVLQFLIENGANVNVTGRLRETPLMRAVKVHPPLVNIVRLMIENGADVNAVDAIGMTPLMHASLHHQNPEILRLLLENGADINAADKLFGLTSLMRASLMNANPESLRLLLENGADINAADKRGNTPLMFMTEYIATLSSLPYSGKRHMEHTDFHLRRFRKSLQLFVENGVDVNAIDNYGKKAIDQFDTIEMRDFLPADILQALSGNTYRGNDDGKSNIE